MRRGGGGDAGEGEEGAARAKGRGRRGRRERRGEGGSRGGAGEGEEARRGRPMGGGGVERARVRGGVFVRGRARVWVRPSKRAIGQRHTHSGGANGEFGPSRMMMILQVTSIETAPKTISKNARGFRIRGDVDGPEAHGFLRLLERKYIIIPYLLLNPNPSSGPLLPPPLLVPPPSPLLPCHHLLCQ